MTYQIINKTLRALVGALFVSVIVAQGQAAPASQSYVPITSAKEMKSVKPGTQVAIQCANCGTVSFVTVGKDGSLPHSYTRPHCKLKFTSRSYGNASVSTYEYSDDAGHKAKIMRPM